MIKKLQIFFLTTLIPTILFNPSNATVVRVIERQLYVNGSPFTVKGVCYSPTPVGSGYRDYRWSEDPSMYKLDFPLITQMGANTIRIYRPPEDREAMDKAYDNGLYVIMDYPVEHGSDVSNPQVRDNIKSGVRNMVKRWKDHPALLIWCIGNEINVNLGGATLSDWYSLAEECAQICHEEEGENFHPVTVANCELEKQVKGTFFMGDESDLSDDNSMKHLDIWSVQTYRGKSFANYPDTSTTLFSSYTVLSEKPLLFTEFGCDAYDVIEDEEAQESQAEYIESQWQEISVNLSENNPDAVCIGGCVFEWSDDWSKNQSGSPDSTHNTEATWGGDGSGGGYEFDFVYGTDNMNEEWWGLTSINTSDYSKASRKAYYTLKTLWGSRDVAKKEANSPFRNDPLNFPNPFRLGAGEATITFTVLAKTKVKVEIYDILGNHITLIEEGTSQDGYTDYKLAWDGRDEWDRIVPCGLYILRIEAESPSMKKTKYRKILALK